MSVIGLFTDIHQAFFYLTCPGSHKLVLELIFFAYFMLETRIGEIYIFLP